MAIMLPQPVADFLNFFGIIWINVDEDQVRELGGHVKTFGQNLSDTHSDATQTIKQMGEVYQGASSDAMSKAWGDMSTNHMDAIADGCSTLGTALDVGADFITGVKIAAIAQIVVTVALFVADQIAAPFTFGLSELAFPALEEVGEQIAKKLVKTVIDYAEDQVITAALTPLEGAVGKAVEGMVFKGNAGPGADAGNKFKIDVDALTSLAKKMGGHADDAAEHAETFSSQTSGLTFQ